MAVSTSCFLQILWVHQDDDLSLFVPTLGIRKNKNSQAVEIGASLTSTESWAKDALLSDKREGQSSSRPCEPSTSAPLSSQETTSKPEVGSPNVVPSTSQMISVSEKEPKNPKILTTKSKSNDRVSNHSRDLPSHSDKSLRLEATSSPAKRVRVE